MANTLSNPQYGAAILGTLTSSTATATNVATINDATSAAPSVGTSAGSFNLAYTASGTVATGTPVVLDTTALTDPLGASINFGHVNIIKLTNNSTTTGQDLTMGGGSNPLFGSISPVARANGGFLEIADPNPGIATSGSVKNIQISAAAGTNVAFALTILGRTV